MNVAQLRIGLQGEAVEVQSHEEQLVGSAHGEKHVGVGIIQLEQLALAAYLLVAGRTVAEGSIHVHVMRGEVQGHQELENHDVFRVGNAQVADQRRGGASVGDHVENGTKLGGLLQSARSSTVERVQKTGNAVEEGAVLRMPAHVEQRQQREQHPRVANQIRNIEKHLLGRDFLRAGAAHFSKVIEQQLGDWLCLGKCCFGRAAV